MHWADWAVPLPLIGLALVNIPIMFVFVRKMMFVRSARASAAAVESARETGFDGTDSPRVCVQLPVYNEPTQAKALIESVSRLEWPDDRLEVQVLDDSSDDTPLRVEEAIERIRLWRPGLSIEHIRRVERKGYKAGALNEGLRRSKSDYFAIFDADFRPNSDFLVQLVPRLARDEKAAYIQAIWSYVNDSKDMFARLQASLLNTHFYIEHAGRQASGYPFNFNGTAGMWRRQALEDLGGWSDHSVTEDLYLSYNAYLRGWHSLLAPDVHCSSLLPEDLPSFLVQQRRWAKGSGQVLRLLGLRLLRERSWSLSVRMDVVSHLLGYALTSLVTFVFLFGFFWLQERAQWVEQSTWLALSRILDAVFWLSFWGLIVGTYASKEAHVAYSKRGASARLPPVSLPIRLGRAIFLVLVAPLLSVFISPSFWRGLILPGRPSELVFNRTPKWLESRSLGAGDHLIAIVILGVFAGLLAQSLWLGLPILAVMFGSHLVCSAWLWIRMGRPGVYLRAPRARGQDTHSEMGTAASLPGTMG